MINIHEACSGCSDPKCPHCIGSNIVEQVEAVELFNFLNNERDLYSMMATRFKRFQHEKAKNDYNNCYAEASCHEVALMASRRYCRVYCPSENPSVMFPLAIRSDCAKLMVREFETEYEAGNRW
jgi:hypothetical protein